MSYTLSLEIHPAVVNELVSNVTIRYKSSEGEGKPEPRQGNLIPEVLCKAELLQRNQKPEPLGRVKAGEKIWGKREKKEIKALRFDSPSGHFSVGKYQQSLCCVSITMAFEAEVSPIERKLALLALQKRDSSIKSILTHAPHAVLFHLNHFPASGDPTPTWEKLDIEGVLYLVSTITGQFRLILFDNEQAPSGAGLDYSGVSQRNMWMADLSHDVVAEQHGHTLHLRTANNEVFALWMARPEVADRVCSYVGSILSARPLPSPPSPSDLLKMILARRPTSGPQEAPAASSSPSESVDAADSVQGSEGKQGPSSTSVPSVEGSNSSATFSSNSSNMAAGQHILSLLKGGNTDAPVESPGSSRASSNSGQPASSPAESVASGEGGLAGAAPNPQGATTVDTFEMLQAELSKPNDDDDESVSGRPREEEEGDDDGTAPDAVEGISVTKDTLRQALVDVVSSDEFMEMLTQRLRQI